MNAAKFTPGGGRIAVTAHPIDRARVALVVDDTGIGVPEELQGRIFDLFAQENAGSSRSQGGLGIGLTLCKRLVELHGGRVSLVSAGRDRGTSVSIELPVVAPMRAPAPSHATESGTSEPAPGGALRVLVVEDIPDARESFVMLLEMDGHEVRAAGTGAEALHVLGGFQPDVAFVDLGLPDMDGYEVARRLRDDDRSARTTLVALSGYGSDEDKEACRRVGFERHLTKPASVESIRGVLTGCAARMRRSAIGGRSTIGPLVS
jgi:CheY-like chemotaxis protein